MNETESTAPLDWRRLPWATAGATIAAVIIYFSSPATQALVFDRTLIASGQWWRLLTGTWVHFVPGALFWNLAVLIPAGGWAEWLAPARTRWLYLVAPVFIGAVLYFSVPTLDRYAGLSGVATGMIIMLAMTQLRLGEQDRWFWRAAIALVALKVAVEAFRANPRFAGIADAGLQAVPLSHLAGISAAIAARSARRRVRTPRQ